MNKCKVYERHMQHYSRISKFYEQIKDWPGAQEPFPSQVLKKPFPLKAYKTTLLYNSNTEYFIPILCFVWKGKKSKE